MSSRKLELALEIVVPCAVVGIWAAWSASSESFYFPPLTEILQAFADTWIFERVGSDVVPSMTNMFVGLGVAVISGVLVGIPMGMYPLIRSAASPIVEFLRAIPPPALIPLGVVIIGANSTMRTSVIAAVCFFPILLNTVDGIRGIDPTVEETCSVYRIPRARYIRSVLLPAAAPQIMAGVRAALSLALILMVISEMVASTEGLGYFVLQAQRSFAITEMWAGILLIGAIGYVLNLLFVLLEHRVLRWHRSARGHQE